MKLKTLLQAGLILAAAVVPGARGLAAETLVFANTSRHPIQFIPIPRMSPPAGTVKAMLDLAKPAQKFEAIPDRGLTVPVNGVLYLELDTGVAGSKDITRRFEIRGLWSRSVDRSSRWCTLVLQTHAKDPRTPVTLKAVASRDHSAELTLETHPSTIYFFDGFLPTRSSKHQVVPLGSSDPGPVLGEEREERALEALDALIDSVLAETALDRVPEEKETPQAGPSKQA